MANNHSEIEKRLWASADELRANSKLKSSEYSVPVLGLIFLRYADHKFAIAEEGPRHEPVRWPASNLAGDRVPGRIRS
jgi:type I restriction-modification system DNA methylase subunit